MKPSIFSNNYNRRMRQRRAKRILKIVILLIIVFLGAFSLGKFDVKNRVGMALKSVSNVFSKVPKNIDVGSKKNSAKTKSAANKTAVKNNSKVKKTVDEKSYDIKLDNSTTIKAIYEDSNGTKKFKNVTGGNNVYYNISPSLDKIIISNNQNMLLVNIDGTTTDVTKNEYVDSKGNSYSKDNELNSNPQYVWCNSPKFIDEDNIAYISNLPWFNSAGTKYIWIANISSKNHTCVQSLSGNDVKLDTITDKGLTVILDGKTQFLKADGSVSE